MYRLSRSRKTSVRASRVLRVQLRVEELESRMVLTVFTPAQITHAYGIDIKFGGVQVTAQVRPLPSLMLTTHTDQQRLANFDNNILSPCRTPT